jgi:DNA-binding NarL/FixJ family response regulator
MRIALCSKENLFRDSLLSLLRHEGNFDVVRSSADSRECLASVKELGALAIVIDGDAMDMSELEFLLGARAFGDFGIVFVLSDPSRCSDAMGPDAVLSRAEAGLSLIQTVRGIASPFNPLRAGGASHKRGSRGEFGLTRREYEIACLIAKGLSNRQIAVRLDIGEQSIKNAVSFILRKLKCENRVQVALQLAHFTEPLEA